MDINITINTDINRCIDNRNTNQNTFGWADSDFDWRCCQQWKKCLTIDLLVISCPALNIQN